MNSSFDAPIELPALLKGFQRFDFDHKLGICERLFGRALAVHGIAWVHTAPGVCWKLDLTNHTHRWIVYGSYEGPGFWRWLRGQPRIDTIVDSGANIGQTVLYFSQFASEARILAFEPGTSARAWLTECVSANSMERVQIEASALGAASGEARLIGPDADDLHGSWNQVSATQGEPIKVTTLDAELQRMNMDVLNLWKLDLEGYEFQALQGAVRALDAGRIRALHMELSGDDQDHSHRFLTARGYRPHTITPSGRLVAGRVVKAYDSVLYLAPSLPTAGA